MKTKALILRGPTTYAAVGLLGAGLTLLAVRAHAAGIPDPASALTYTGYLEDATDAPLSGKHAIAVNFWADRMMSAKPLCTGKLASADLQSGRFQVPLPKDCADAVSANPNLWVDVEIDGTSLGATALGAVPYALEAAHATKADSATTATTATSASQASGALKTTVDALNARSDLKVAYKGGDNGTVTCDTWCADPKRGDTGTCVGAQWQAGPQSGQYCRCSDTVDTTGQAAAASLQCFCAHP